MTFTADTMHLNDIIFIRDIIERIEELETEQEDYNDSEDGQDIDAPTWAETDKEAHDELAALTDIMTDLAGNGGDEQWRGDWYPQTLIRDSYFKDYAQELAEDIGAVDANAAWPNNCIDWDYAARELKYDYTSTEIDGVTYWYR